jgi:hypothetical protein
MPADLFVVSLSELRQRVGEHLRDAQTSRTELIEIRTHSNKAISQSRELMARVDVLLTLPYVKQRL